MQYYGNDTIWSIGRVEDVHDPLQAGRVRVRIIGLHSELLSELPTDALPWSQVLMPVTSASFNGAGTSPTGLKYGSQVMGIFMDGENKQNFLVLGSIPGIEESALQIQTVIGGNAITKPGAIKSNTVQSNVQLDPLKQLVEPVEFIKVFFSENLKYGRDPSIGIALYFDAKLNLGDKHISREELAQKIRSLFDEPAKVDDYCKTYGLNSKFPESVLIYVHAILASGIFPKISITDDTTAIKLKPARTYAEYAQSVEQSIGGASQGYKPLDYTQKKVKETSKVKSLHTPGSKKPSAPDFGSVITIPQLMKKFVGCTRRDSAGKPINGLVIHATAHFNTSSTGLTLVNEIRNSHINDRKWSDIGYHFIIGIDGEIYVGRNINEQGSHAGSTRKGSDQYVGKGWNYQTVGVALMRGLGDPPRKADGSIDRNALKRMINDGVGLKDRLITRQNGRMTKAYTPAQLNTLTEFIRTFITAFPNSQVLGHNQVDTSGKLDPYFDVPEYLADRLKSYFGKK